MRVGVSGVLWGEAGDYVNRHSRTDGAGRAGHNLEGYGAGYF